MTIKVNPRYRAREVDGSAPVWASTSTTSAPHKIPPSPAITVVRQAEEHHHELLRGSRSVGKPGSTRTGTERAGRRCLAGCSTSPDTRPLVMGWLVARDTRALRDQFPERCCEMAPRRPCRARSRRTPATTCSRAREAAPRRSTTGGSRTRARHGTTETATLGCRSIDAFDTAGEQPTPVVSRPPTRPDVPRETASDHERRYEEDPRPADRRPPTAQTRRRLRLCTAGIARPGRPAGGGGQGITRGSSRTRRKYGLRRCSRCCRADRGSETAIARAQTVNRRLRVSISVPWRAYTLKRPALPRRLVAAVTRPTRPLHTTCAAETARVAVARRPTRPLLEPARPIVRIPTCPAHQGGVRAIRD